VKWWLYRCKIVNKKRGYNLFTQIEIEKGNIKHCKFTEWGAIRVLQVLTPSDKVELNRVTVMSGLK